MGAQNKVIAGDYIGKMTGVSLGQLYIATSFGKPMYLNKQNIEAYELITDEQRKSAASGVIRGAVGATLLGPVGLLAGLSAKNKGNKSTRRNPGAFAMDELTQLLIVGF